MDTGEKLKLMRENRKLSVAQMATRLGCSRQTIYNVESNIDTRFDLVVRWVQETEPDVHQIMDLFSGDHQEPEPVIPRWLAKILPQHFIKLVKGDAHGNQEHVLEQGNDHPADAIGSSPGPASRHWPKSINN